MLPFYSTPIILDAMVFNCFLSYREGGIASDKFKSKIKQKDDTNKFEWWKRQKNKKNKYKNKNKKPERPTTTKRTTTTPTTRTTRRMSSLTTWFPQSSRTTTSNYFSRPLDHQKPVNVKNVWWNKIDQTTSEIF